MEYWMYRKSILPLLTLLNKDLKYFDQIIFVVDIVNSANIGRPTEPTQYTYLTKKAWQKKLINQFKTLVTQKHS